jgi:hypothetical protein
MNPFDQAWAVIKYDIEEVKRRLIDSGNFERTVDHMIEDSQPGSDRKLPRPYGLMSHEALNHLEHRWHESDVQDIFDDPNFAFEKTEDGTPLWSMHNLTIGGREPANPEILGHMMGNRLEGKPLDFDEILRETYLRDLENTPWKLPKPVVGEFLGMKMNPTSTTSFSTVTGKTPTDTLEQIEGKKGRGFQDIYTGEPMEIAYQLLKFGPLGRLAQVAAGTTPKIVGGLPKTRQTKLYNFDPNMPSPHGPVKLFHGTHSGRKDAMMTQGLEADKMKRGKVYTTSRAQTADNYARSNADWQNTASPNRIIADQKKPQVFGIRAASGPGESASHGVQPYRTFAGRVHPDLLVDMGQSAGGAQSSLSSTNRIQGQ